MVIMERKAASEGLAETVPRAACERMTYCDITLHSRNQNGKKVNKSVFTRQIIYQLSLTLSSADSSAGVQVDYLSTVFDISSADSSAGVQVDYLSTVFDISSVNSSANVQVDYLWTAFDTSSAGSSAGVQVDYITTCLRTGLWCWQSAEL